VIWQLKKTKFALLQLVSLRGLAKWRWFAVGRTDIFDDKASMLYCSWQTWSWQNCIGFKACSALEMSTY